MTQSKCISRTRNKTTRGNPSGTTRLTVATSSQQSHFGGARIGGKTVPVKERRITPQKTSRTNILVISKDHSISGSIASSSVSRVS